MLLLMMQLSMRVEESTAVALWVWPTPLRVCAAWCSKVSPVCWLVSNHH